VFGFLPGSATPDAQSYLDNRWCPFNNPTGPNCTKDRVEDPLGVCSILHNDHPTITCPVRFRQDWRIVRDAAAFFFPRSAQDVATAPAAVRGAAQRRQRQISRQH